MKKLSSFVSLILIISVYSCSPQKSRVSVVSDISLPPVSTFKNNCAQCHGYARTIYSKSIRNMENEALRREIEGMMIHNADLNPDSIDVDAMVAYSISLKNSELFAVALNSKSFLEGKVDYLKIETSPNTAVEVRNDHIRIQEEQKYFQLFYDPTKIKKLKITATSNDGSASFDFPDELWVQ